LPELLWIFEPYRNAKQVRGNAAGFGPKKFFVVSKEYIRADQRERCAQAWSLADR
jgi:hypothetical protein